MVDFGWAQQNVLGPIWKMFSGDFFLDYSMYKEWKNIINTKQLEMVL